MWPGRGEPSPGFYAFLHVPERTVPMRTSTVPRLDPAPRTAGRWSRRRGVVAITRSRDVVPEAASDIFLGRTKGVEADRYLYWRQLRGMKGSALVEMMTPSALRIYAGFCGWTLARAHARSGDAIALAGYLGKSDDFDHAITDFSERYADQNDLDYKSFCTAVESGRLVATSGV